MTDTTATENNYIFFAHQNRIKGYVIDTFNKCILDPTSIILDGDIVGNRINDDDSSTSVRLEITTKKKLIEKNKFCNGMILCLKMELYAIPGATQDATQGATQAPTAKLAKLTLSLIYAGDESSIKNGEKYWTNNPINNNSLQQFNTISLAIGFDEFKTIFGMKKEHYKFSVVNILETYKTLNLYIVRHGYSYHNQKWYEKNPLKSDTNLITLPPVIRELIDKFLKKNYDVKEKYIVKEYLVNYFSNNNNYNGGNQNQTNSTNNSNNRASFQSNSNNNSNSNAGGRSGGFNSAGSSSSSPRATRIP